MAIAGDRPPRYDKKTLPLHVGRGPVPRQRSRAGKNVSCSLQVCKTLMSIARAPAKNPKVL